MLRFSGKEQVFTEKVLGEIEKDSVTEHESTDPCLETAHKEVT